MKQASRKIIAMIIVSLWILPFGILVGSSQVFAFGGSVQVTITGTFIAKKAKGDTNVFMLTVHDEKTMLKKLFKVTDIDTDRGSPWVVLNNLFPPRMNIIGDDKDIKIFRQDDIVGKSYTIKGNLYLNEGILYVGSVNEATKRK
jgi:hypothetical protein